MGWSKWFSDGTGEKTTEKTTTRSDGSSKYESLRSNNGSKSDHQHVYINRDASGNYAKDHRGVVGGSTPGKKS